ncbi:hypothetical protein ASPNIDRAFT_127828, partial [Aspergillus niger ATCC 1015]
MAHWKEEYSAALAARDRREKASIAIYDASTASNPQRSDPVEAQHVPPDTSASRSSKTPTGAGAQDPSLQETLLATRADLAEAQRSRSELQDQLTRMTTDLEKLRKRSTQDSRRIRLFETEIAHLQLHELASLNLQLNMAEERSSRLQKENQDLVDRWMARMGREAEAMNAASEFS